MDVILEQLSYTAGEVCKFDIGGQYTEDMVK